MAYTMYADAGHAWLKVKKSELFNLGIAEKITRYSYQYGEFAYLEEDCDLSTFVDAIGREKWQTIKDKIPLKMSEFSRIRSYATYTATQYRKPKPGDYIKLAGNSNIFMIIDDKTCRDKVGNYYRLPKNRITGEFFAGF
ncbi:MAG: hypothetical protein RL661_902 [Pseudomonadota bacterium]|jgi:hypothetical protein